ncbi:hypothetical protein GCM10022254_40340 [Actinomadura meridiana]|uniref:Uncharacterized protein n=1 Tax=Actinomadura meridiana TaxID=559626 RepID=A0ABP8C6T8_9ACTN
MGRGSVSAAHRCAWRKERTVGRHEDPAEMNGHKPGKPIPPPPDKGNKGDGKRGK